MQLTNNKRQITNKCQLIKIQNYQTDARRATPRRGLATINKKKTPATFAAGVNPLKNI
jgi:hypothetical protein